VQRHVPHGLHFILGRAALPVACRLAYSLGIRGSVEPSTTVGLLLALIGPLLIAKLGDRTDHGEDRVLRLLAAQAALILLVLTVLWLAHQAEGLAWKEIGLKRPNLTSVLLGIALAALFVFVYGPAIYWLMSKLRLGGFERGLQKLEGLPVWYLLVAVLVGGSAEEVLYRGYAFERLASITGSIWLAGVIPLALFSIAHVPMWGWPAAGTMLLSGGILTAWYAWHRDLTANIMAHCLTDFVSIVLPSAIQGYRAKRRHA
jgi:uncharacterized protein